VLFGSVLFFVAFLESVPKLSKGLLPMWLCNFLMGFGVLWIAQFHLSWIVLLPLLAVSFFHQARMRLQDLPGSMALALLGASLPGVFLVPTFLRFGMGSGGMADAVSLHYSNLLSFFNVLGQYLSFACGEVPRFIGRNTALRVEFLRRHLWAAPFTLMTLILGIVHALFLLFSVLRRPHPIADWRAVKTVTFLVFILIYSAFLFSVKGPTSYSFYLALPLVSIYGFYALYPWARHRWFRLAGMTLLICNGIFHLSLAVDHFHEKSLFSYRNAILEALEQRDYRLLGERRPHSLY
jgi:hypothetical protein